MTNAAHARPVPVQSLEEAIAAVRQDGRRLSAPRRHLLEALFEGDGPVTAAQLAHTLALDESSVYRNLEVLERHGLVHHVHLGHGPGLYVLVRDREAEYLYCERCRKVITVAPDQLESARREIRRHFGFHAHFTHFALVGMCEDCAQRRPAAAAAAAGSRREPATRPR